MTTQQITWQEYDGSDPQIAELRNAQYGFIAKNMNIASGILKVRYNQLFLNDDKRPIITELFGDTLKRFLDHDNTTHYWVIPADPLREMKIRWSQTGQPVWVRKWHDLGYIRSVTTSPNWNIPNAEYSFTPWED